MDSCEKEFKRPCAKETEEDLLRQQKAFLEKKKKSSFKTWRENKQENICRKKETIQFSNKIKNQLGSSDDDLVILNHKVVFDVKERDVSSEPFTFKLPSVSPSEMDDLILKKVNIKQINSQEKNQSIFSQLLQKDEDTCKIEKKLDSTEDCLLIDDSDLSGDAIENELRKIHETNLATLSSMSKEEILLEQEKLKKQLSPDIVKFIQSRNKNKIKIGQSKSSKIHFGSSDGEEYATQILRKEGRKACDALLLEKAINLESDTLSKQTGLKTEKKLNKTSNIDANIEIPEETKDLLIKCNKGKWKNMNKIEKEKLEWMSELPKICPKNVETGCTARFDFQGKLLFCDTETPTFKGLHHHGEEPELAGYSIEELLLLARSTVQSQRILALHTIAHILDNYWYGMLDGCFDELLLPLILKAGIVPLLRWALDDTSLTSVAATITAIHSLLICKSDEVCLQRVFTWLSGHIVPQIKPHNLIEPDIVLDELTDADLIKLDVVKAFLRMDILPRFLYILYVLHPSPLVCKLMIEIITHFCQHSVDSAVQVAKHPGLLKIVFLKFLPHAWQFIDGSKLSDSVNYCSPIPSTMKLMRIIASSSKELASYLIDTFDLVSIITLYLPLHPDDGKVHFQDFHLLIVETLKTYHSLLCYGFGLHIFLEIFPIFLKQMDFCLSLDLNSEKSRQDSNYTAHLFKVFEAVAVVSVKSEDEGNVSAEAIHAIFQKSLICLKKWLWQFPQSTPSDSGMTLLASCLNFVSTFCHKSHDGLTCEDWKPCSEITEIFGKYLIPCIKSKVFESLLENLKCCSGLLSSNQSGNKRDGKTLVSLGGIMWAGDIIPSLKEGSSTPLLLSILKFSVLQKQLFSDETAVLSEFLRKSCIKDYITAITAEKLNVCSWFSRFETHLIFYFLQLSTLTACEDSLFWYKAGISLISVLRTPDESLLEDLFETLVFNPPFLLHSVEESVSETMSRISIISKDFTSCILETENLLDSKSLLNRNLDLISISCSSNSSFFLSSDWCYAPIYEINSNPKLRQSDGSLLPATSLQVTSCLQWIYICYEFNLPILKDIPGSVEFCYLSMVFLIDSDYFRQVGGLLEKCILALLKCKKINLSKIKWNNLNGFDDLYLEMLNQYEAVSYCDPIFGNFVLFPLQQCYPNRWKKLLLMEHYTTLRFLRAPLSKLFVPIQSYLEPCETDFEILSTYFKLVEYGTVTHIVCPLLFLMSISHLKHFIYSKDIELRNKQKSLLSNILTTKRKELKQWILLFSEPNIDSQLGFTMKQQLSVTDQEHLSSILGKQITL